MEIFISGTRHISFEPGEPLHQGCMHETTRADESSVLIKREGNLMNEAFYLVWNPKTGYTQFRHKTRAEAQKEAERMAKNNRGEEFIVLAPLSSSKVVDVETVGFRYTGEDDIPF